MAIQTLQTTPRRIDLDVLRQLEPIRSLSAMRLRELAVLCTTETASQGADPFRVHQSGRRSSVAAFLLSQRGNRASWLEGGCDRSAV